MVTYYYGHRQANIEELYAVDQIGMDTETVSIDDKTLLGVSISLNPLEGYYFTGDDIPWDLVESDIPKVLANYRFDEEVVNKVGYSLGGHIDDSTLAAHVSGYPPALQDYYIELTGRYIPSVKSWFNTNKIPKKEQKASLIPEDVLAEMSCQHACATLHAWNILKKDLPWKAYDLEMEIAPILSDIEKRGLRIDQEALEILAEQLEYDKALYETASIAFGLNVCSSQQLAEELLRRGFNLPKNYKTKNYMTNEVTLLTVCPNDPVAQLCMKLRSVRYDLSHYVKKYKGKDIIYPHFNQTGADTGRLSCSNPNLQNVPLKLRNLFLPTQEGAFFESWDLSQVELRTLAYFSQDPIMFEIYKNDGDIHQTTMNLIGCDRRLAKICNFGMSYGATENALVNAAIKDNVSLTKSEATDLMRGYFDKYKGVKQYIDNTRKFAQQNGYVTTLYGAKRNIFYTGDRKYDWHADNQAINTPIQGSAGEIMKEMLKHLRDQYINLTVHDDVTFERFVGSYLPEPFEFDLFYAPATRKVGPNLRDQIKL